MHIKIFFFLQVIFLVNCENVLRDKIVCLTSKETQSELVLSCDLSEKSGYTYNVFNINITDIYDFYITKTKPNELVELLKSEPRVINVQIEDFMKKIKEISFTNGEWQFLPVGFDSIFSSLKSFNATNCGLLILDKMNMKQFGDQLNSANFSNNLLTFLTQDLFEYNSNLKNCDFNGNPLLNVPDYFLEKHSFSIDLRKTHCSIVDQFYDSFIHCKNKEMFINYEHLASDLMKIQRNPDILCSLDKSSQTCNFIQNKTWLILKRIVCIKKIKNQPSQESILHGLNLFDSPSICDGLSEGVRLKWKNISELGTIPNNLVNYVQQKIMVLEMSQCDLSYIDEYDMKQFGNNLQFADFRENNLESIGKNAFIHNRQLSKVILIRNNIKYIDSKYIITKEPLYEKWLCSNFINQP